jgi:xylulokinase
LIKKNGKGRMRMRVIAGVDSSTQSTKVEIRELESGQLLGEGRAAHPPVSPPRSEQDPASWEKAFYDAFSEAVAAAGLDSNASEHSLAAISVGAQQHGMVVLDEQGRVIRPAKLWNDTESAPDALALRKELPGGDAAWAQACGSVPVAALTITKLAWLKRCEPDAFARLRTVLLPHDWLTWRLTGRFITDRGDASGTGYWSPSQNDWRPDLLSLVDGDVDWEATLPQVLGPTEPAGEWKGTLVGPGTGDNMAAALGIGLSQGDTAISLGTSGTAFCVSEHPIVDPMGYVEGFADASGRYLPLACTLNATKVTDTIGSLLGVDHDELAKLALEAPPGAHGLVLVPYFDGERTPNRPWARGGLAGMSTATTRGDLARAAFEGVACSLLDARDHLLRSEHHSGSPAPNGGQPTHRPERIFLVGGGARSKAYQQIFADLSGTEIIIPDLQESVAAGACIQAAAVAKKCKVSDIIQTWGLGHGRVVEPKGGIPSQEIRERYSEIAKNLLWDTEDHL